mmetsp:Transcript_47733/g.111749  ORF Transcript_47733/g.111749 Transcript_47733/m.111749 type:complete len:205 (+) Transcript_47733:7498-8112(+)
MKGHGVGHIVVIKAGDRLQRSHDAPKKTSHVLQRQILPQFLATLLIRQDFPLVRCKVCDTEHGQAKGIHILRPLQLLCKEEAQLRLPQGYQASEGQAPFRLAGLDADLMSRLCDLCRSKSFTRGHIQDFLVIVDSSFRHSHVGGHISFHIRFHLLDLALLLFELQFSILRTCVWCYLVGSGAGKVPKRLRANCRDGLVAFDDLW